MRFLIAETESGYTLLAALWLARLFGIETADRDQPAVRNRRRAGARRAGAGGGAAQPALPRLSARAPAGCALQFGYSDSGRYVGQLAASYLIERLRLKIGRDCWRGTA